MIISVIGLSGSGKSTLGRRIKKKRKDITVIDTDDIDDKNFFEVMKKMKNIKTQKGFGRYLTKMDEANIKSINEIIDGCKTKYLVFVGVHHIGMEDILKKKSDKIFEIEISNISQLYQQQILRTLNTITKNEKQIKSIVKNPDLSNRTKNLLIYRYTKTAFPIDGPYYIDPYFKPRKERKVIRMNSDEIFEYIVNLK